MADRLRDRLGYEFRDPALLGEALTHRSFGVPHNERLEFVGDAVLNCAVALILFERFPATQEGELSRARANLVNRDTLAQIARQIDLGARIRLGEGEQKSGGANRSSIIADALEAVIGAVFFDGGFSAARAVIDRIYADLLRAADPTTLGKDPKTRLQEWLQARRHPVPEYAIVATSGEAHAQLFEVDCKIAPLSLITHGSGSSRRAAEQEAAAAALARIMAGGADD
ncbi:MAG TPA: ribonuclease III [Casimicrobiaceae bacterium]